MSESIIVALITGGLSLLGAILTGRKSSKDLTHRLEMHQAVTDAKLEELTREVREHNNFARRMPAVEHDIVNLTDAVKELRRFHME